MKQDRVVYKKRIKELPKEILPREKAIKYGVESLSDEELLALSLGSGTKGINVLGLSTKILGGKGVKGLLNLKLEDLLSIKGIGEAKALQILAISQMIKRSSQTEDREKISSVTDAVKYLRFLTKENQEMMVALYLNSSNEVLHQQTVAVGSLNVLRVLPRDILFYAIKYNCNGIIVSHNHPNGSAKPSQEDINFTQKLVNLSVELGFDILDHIIIGKDGYFSFAEAGLIN